MAGLLSTALVAVSVTVASPAPVAPAAQWLTAPTASLASAIENWADEAGVARPQIDPRVAAYKIGKVNIRANDLCQAASGLTAALRYAEPRPIVSCNAAGQLLGVSAQTVTRIVASR